MSQDEEAPANVCIGVCKIHKEYKICYGCYRSPLEIKLWHVSTAEQKRSIIRDLEFKKNLYGVLL